MGRRKHPSSASRDLQGRLSLPLSAITTWDFKPPSSSGPRFLTSPVPLQWWAYLLSASLPCLSLPLMLNQACLSPGTGRGSTSQVGGGGHSLGLSQRSKLKESSSLPQKTPQNPKQQPRMYLRGRDFLASWPQKYPLYLY